MKIIKRFALRIALNRVQRVALWRALRYSAHKYHQHGKEKEAQAFARIVSQVEPVFNITTKNYTEGEVGKALDEFVAQIHKEIEHRISAAYESGRRAGMTAATQTLRHGRSVAVGEVVEVEEDPNENAGAATTDTGDVTFSEGSSSTDQNGDGSEQTVE